jgi:hypothetical protein
MPVISDTGAPAQQNTHRAGSSVSPVVAQLLNAATEPRRNPLDEPRQPDNPTALLPSSSPAPADPYPDNQVRALLDNLLQPKQEKPPKNEPPSLLPKTEIVETGSHDDPSGANFRFDPHASRLSVEEYNNLTPAQRAAVDFNTMLAKAAKQDAKAAVNRDPHPNGDQASAFTQAVDTYGKAYDKILGDNRIDGVTGDAFYKPQTLALLEQLGYKNPEASIADFTSLRSAITQHDIDRWLTKDPETGHLPVPGVNDQRGTQVQQLVHETRALEASLAKGNKLLQNLGTSAAVERSSAVAQFGGTPVTAPGTGQEPTKIGDFTLVYNALLNAQDPQTVVSQLPKFFEDIRARYGASPDDFYSYAGNRAAFDKQAGGVDVTATLNKILGLQEVPNASAT